MITIDQFQRLDLQIGTIKAARRLEESKKLIVLTVDLGSEERTILAGIGKTVTDPQTLIDRQAVFLVNLEPKELAGVMSNGMLLAANSENGPVLLQPAIPVEPGIKIQ